MQSANSASESIARSARFVAAVRTRVATVVVGQDEVVEPGVGTGARWMRGPGVKVQFLG